MDVDSDLSSEGGSSSLERLIQRSFWVARVPSAVFSDHEETSLKSEFQNVFKVYDELVQFTYMKSFGRVQVTYSTEELAKQAKDNLRNQEFQGQGLKVCPIKPIRIGESTLMLPQRTKQFLISPPTSPPVGWEQTEEATPQPVVDFSLVTALAKLQLPGDIQELYEGSDSHPSIVVVTPEENSEADRLPTVLRHRDSVPSVNISALPPNIVHTARPPFKELS